MSDEAAEALLELARASLPFESAPDSFGGLSPRVPRVRVPVGHAAEAKFNEAAKNDAAFQAVFEAGDNGLYVTAGTGIGWRVQEEQLGWSIMNSAGQKILYSENALDDVGAFEAAVVSSLDEARRFLSGEEVESRTITGFSGIALAPGTSVETPWGTLRRAGEVEEQISLRGGPTPTAIVETVVGVKAVFDEADTARVLGGEWSAKVQELALLLPLSVLLGVQRETHYVVCDWLWQTTLVPIQSGWGWTGKPSGSFTRFLQPTELDDKDMEALGIWTIRVGEGYDENLAVAARRTMSAVRERVDPEDALIDAVVACENLFGHGGDSEVTFRVTSAIAVLLEPNQGARAAYRSRLGKVYKARSQVVHGGTVDGVRLNDFKEEAIGTAIRSLRCLFEFHPHLLSDRDRGMRLILRTDTEADSPSHA